MGAIMNGMSLCKLRVFGSGFFVFSDYMKPVIRLSALMEIPVAWIFTHDSIGVGEDGPTHQPVEVSNVLNWQMLDVPKSDYQLTSLLFVIFVLI